MGQPARHERGGRVRLIDRDERANQQTEDRGIVRIDREGAPRGIEDLGDARQAVEHALESQQRRQVGGLTPQRLLVSLRGIRVAPGALQLEAASQPLAERGRCGERGYRETKA